MKRDYTDWDASDIINYIACVTPAIVGIILILPKDLFFKVQGITMDPQIIVAVIALVGSVTAGVLTNIGNSRSVKKEMANMEASLSELKNRICEKTNPAISNIRNDSSSIRRSVDNTISPGIEDIRNFVNEQRIAIHTAKNNGSTISDTVSEIIAFAEKHQTDIENFSKRERELLERISKLESRNEELLKENGKYREIIRSYKRKLYELTRDDGELER